MRFFQKKNIAVLAAVCTVLGLAGCNLFNPTEDVSIKSDDAEALTYEGYIKFRDNEYTEAAKYFSEAIEADSTHSEAWFGLAKAKLNMMELNTFELLKYVNISSGTNKIPLTEMSDETAEKYETGIDSIVTFLKQFIYLDTTGKLDGVITYKKISDSYMLLNMVGTMLTLREATTAIPGCTSVDPKTGTYNCNLGTVLNSMKDGDITETVKTFHEVFSTCEDNPEMVASIAGEAIPVFSTMLTDQGQTETASIMCGTLSDMTDNSEDSSANSDALNAVIAMSGYSEFTDDDGDGCFDEEILDGADNDGDGEIDEDLRDVNDNFVLDMTTIAKNSAVGKKETKDQLIYSSFEPNTKYAKLDIDMNGLKGADDDDEWTYIYTKYADRSAKNDYRLKFAKNLIYNPSGLSDEEFASYKKLVAADHDGTQYDLETRKAVIGGCWANYDSKKFKAWINQWSN